MNDTNFDGFDQLYHHAKFGEDRATFAGCRCENMVFVCLFFCQVPRPACGSFEECTVRTSMALLFIGRFRRDSVGPVLRLDHKMTPISKFWDPLITFERMEISASNLAQI